MARARRAVIGDTEGKRAREVGERGGARSGLVLELCAEVSLGKALIDSELFLQTQDDFNGRLGGRT